MADEENVEENYTGFFILWWILFAIILAVPGVGVGYNLLENPDFNPLDTNEKKLLLGIFFLLVVTLIIGHISFGSSMGISPFSPSHFGGETSSCMSGKSIQISRAQYRLYITFNIFIFFCFIAGIMISGAVLPETLKVGSAKILNLHWSFKFPCIVFPIVMIFIWWITNTTVLNNCWGQEQCPDDQKCCPTDNAGECFAACPEPEPCPPPGESCPVGEQCCAENQCNGEPGPSTADKGKENGKGKFKIVCKTYRDQEECEDNRDCIWCGEGTKHEDNCINRSSSNNSNTDEEVCNQEISEEEEESGYNITDTTTTFLGETDKCMEISNEIIDGLDSMDDPNSEDFSDPDWMINYADEHGLKKECNEIDGCKWDDDNMCEIDTGNNTEGFALLKDYEQLFSKKINIKSNYKDTGNESYKASTLMDNLENYLMNMLK